MRLTEEEVCTLKDMLDKEELYYGMAKSNDKAHAFESFRQRCLARADVLKKVLFFQEVS